MRTINWHDPQWGQPRPGLVHAASNGSWATDADHDTEAMES
jgi:hypothetical protein